MVNTFGVQIIRQMDVDVTSFRNSLLKNRNTISKYIFMEQQRKFSSEPFKSGAHAIHRSIIIIINKNPSAAKMYCRSNMHKSHLIISNGISN